MSKKYCDASLLSFCCFVWIDGIVQQEKNSAALQLSQPDRVARRQMTSFLKIPHGRLA
jgi:hypothetical protein